jgi:rhodanese-related sulfurtransferase/CBS domain-containing protein
MPTPVDLDRLQQLIRGGAQLVEVLPSAEYDDEHLPGARNIPLKQLNSETAGVLDRSHPVVVYCWDALCDLSPRAGRRLEQLGFVDVYDFVDGKSYWLGSGLRTEGRLAAQPRAGTAADSNVPTCTYADTVGTASAAIALSDWGQCIVVDEHRIVVGRVRTPQLETDPTRRVDEIMEIGPSTIRPDTPLAEIRLRMTERNVQSVIVTKPTGELIGVLRTQG